MEKIQTQPAEDLHCILDCADFTINGFTAQASLLLALFSESAQNKNILYRFKQVTLLLPRVVTVFIQNNMTDALNSLQYTRNLLPPFFFVVVF